MKTEEQTRKRRDMLKELLSNETLAEEVIMGGKQRALIRTKINVLDWVLDEEVPELNDKREMDKVSNKIHPIRLNK